MNSAERSIPPEQRRFTSIGSHESSWQGNIAMNKPQTVKITVLVENSATHAGLRAEHGLSMLIETDGGNVLWDTGQSPLFIENAGRLGVDLASAGHVALSHGHYDHTGGLEAFLALHPHVQVHAHPDVFQERYSCSGGSARRIGAPAGRDFVENTGAALRLERRITEISPGVFLTGEIPRTHRPDAGGSDFYLDASCTTRDIIPDDQALFIDSAAGIIVLLGCAHAGVIDTLEYISRLTGRREFHAVIGGMHLFRASDELLAETGAAISRFDFSTIAPCHCTGERAQEHFRSSFQDCFVKCETGSRFVFEME